MLNNSQLALAVSHADLAADSAFSSASDYFHTGELDRDWFKDVRTLSAVVAPLSLTQRAFVIIEGDVLGEIELVDGSTVVVCGDVRASVRATGICEIVVAGDVVEGASIFGDGILHVFVGGDLIGWLHSSGLCKAYVQGNVRGQIWTGHPSTELRVIGDCAASIRPTDTPSLLYLDVGGFMPFALLEEAAAVGYTQFNASVGTSDRPAGLYPDKTTYEALRQHRSYNRWVIRDCV